MINSTLGGLIKDYRLQKGVSQLDIAFALGWKEPSRLSRIEQGKTEKPPREIIDKIITAIGLEEEEKNLLLLTGSYLPTEEEINNIRQKLQPMTDNWPYPAAVYDFSWRVISHNRHNAYLYQITHQMEKVIFESQTRVLDILFNSQLQQNSLLATDKSNELKLFLQHVVYNFKYEQRHRTKEKWYIEHVKNLLNNEVFRHIWTEINLNPQTESIVGKYAEKAIINPQKSNEFLQFHMFITPVLIDPRFEIELLVPKDLETYMFYQK